MDDWPALLDRVAAGKDDPEVLEAAGREALALGRRSEAFAWLSRALKLDPARARLADDLRPLAATPADAAEVDRLSRRPSSFKAAVGDAWRFPLRGAGAALLGVGAVLGAICRALFLDPLLAVRANVFTFGIGTVVALVGLLVALAYFAVYFLDILTSTLNGDDEMPEWPDVRRGGLALDASKLANAILAAFAPLWIGLLYALVKAFSDQDPFAWIGGRGAFAAFAAASLAAGSLYLPMAFLANAATGNPLACLNPFFIVRSIAAAPGDAARCSALCLAAVGVVGILELGVSRVVPAPFAGAASVFAQFYGLAVMARAVGLFYRLHRSRLALSSREGSG